MTMDLAARSAPIAGREHARLLRKSLSRPFVADLRRLFRTTVAGLVVFAALSPMGLSQAQAQGVGSVILRGNEVGASISLPINKSQVIETRRDIAQVSVGNPEIADVSVLGPRTVYVFARDFGETTVTLTGENGEVISVIDVEVSRDVAALRRKLYTLFPNQPVAVHTAGEGIVLTGQVSSGAAAARAVEIAERYAPDDVLSLLEIVGSQQIMLAVHFVEMRRQVVEQLGVNVQGIVGGAGAVTGIFDATNILANPRPFGAFGVNVATGNTDIDVLLDVLEQKGVIRTLAEPTLVALSGDSARFLAGGEFPIPVAQEEDTITIEFKSFGVGLAFIPTLLDADVINLSTEMEVSEIDPSISVRLANIEVPGLSVRRAETTVQLLPGQSFMIAGLLSQNFRDQVRQVPFLGDIPVLGALLRSAQYQSGQTELVMIVTPYIVQPTTLERLETPTFYPPTEAELFLFGEVVGDRPVDPALFPGAGLIGPAGYAVR